MQSGMVQDAARPAPAEKEPKIAILRWEDERCVAALLARAFVDDPLVTAICGAPPPERELRMRWSFRVALRSHWLSHQPAWIGNDLDGAPCGVVLATRARTAMASHSDTLFALRGLRHIGVRTAWRGVRAAQVIASHAPPEPFTYLRTLGVDPEHQRRGIGSRLVRQVIRGSPPDLPIYLETAKEENLAFYTRHGFEPAGEFRCLGVRVWRLIRPPTTDSQTVGVAALAHFR